jgi:hypothetical protein
VIDLRTLAFAAVVISVIVAVTFGLVTWNVARDRKPAAWWAVGFALLAAGFLLLMSQGTLPPFLSVVIANTMGIASALALCRGVALFFAPATKIWPALGALATGFLLVLFFTSVVPSFPGRVVVISLSRLAIDAGILSRLIRVRTPGLRPQRAVTAASFLLEALVMLVRTVLAAAGQAREGLFSLGPVSEITFLGSIAAPVCVAVGFLSLVARRTQLEQERTIEELGGALGEVRTLSGLLPICPSCKRIRDEKGDWRPVEVYVRDRTEADFSHDICPECVERLYPGLKLPGR